MNQGSFLGMEASIWTVSDLNRHVRQLLESDYRLQDLWVAGEISNLSQPASGHLYFTLKDGQASLRCVMWRSDARRLISLPNEGEAFEAHGRLSVYEEGGLYQLYVDDLRPSGEGALYQAFLRLRARLEAEGLFDPQRKRPLPAWPKRIGLVTSPSGAALRDVLSILRRRYPLAELILAPSQVQGEEAPGEIVAALRALNEHSQPDLILLVRGGGSLEDLSAFNHESVARAIHASQSPVVTGIGHAIDFTIADFVADRHAPTPSAAAELASPDLSQVSLRLDERRRQLGRAFQAVLQRKRAELERRQLGLQVLSPRAKIASAGQRVDELIRRALSALSHDLALKRASLDRMLSTLKAVGPQAVLERGYALVHRREDARLVRSIGQVKPGDLLDVRVSDGSFEAQTLPTREE